MDADLDAFSAPAPTAQYRDGVIGLAVVTLLLAAWYLAEVLNPRSSRRDRLGPLLGTLLCLFLTVLLFFIWRNHSNW